MKVAIECITKRPFQNDSKMGDFTLKTLCLFSWDAFWGKIRI